MGPIYLDYAATTPTDPRVVEAMQPYWIERFGNPNSLHSWGRKAGYAVEASRQTVADALQCSTQEVLFASSATEANNLAIKGSVDSWRRQTPGRTPHIVVSPIEHHSVLNSVQRLAEDGAIVRWLSVDRFGVIDPAEVEESITSETVLVSVGYGNNEVGTIQPIREIAAGIARRRRGRGFWPLFHTDAVQAIPYLELNVDRLGVDLLSSSAHKFYGPKGVGFLYVRNGAPVTRQMDGGEQESHRRAGTENVPGIVGLAKALELARMRATEERARIEQLRDFFIEGALQVDPRMQLTGHPVNRLPHIASFVCRGINAEALLALLDQDGVAASSGSACTSSSLEPSHVLLAMGIDPEASHGSLRFSLGRATTRAQLEYAAEVLHRSIETVAALAPTR